MKLVTITNLSKDFDFVFVSNEPVTEEVVGNYLYKKDQTLQLEVTPWGLYSNKFEDYIEYKVNFVEEV